MLGTVKGSTIQTVNAFKDIGSGLKTLVGGELGNYNKMMTKAREVATERPGSMPGLFYFALISRLYIC